jgi:hypothetical protein
VPPDQLEKLVPLVLLVRLELLEQLVKRVQLDQSVKLVPRDQLVKRVQLDQSVKLVPRDQLVRLALPVLLVRRVLLALKGRQVPLAL